MPIRRYIADGAAFDPNTIKAMSEALESTCAVLNVDDQIHKREVVAARIIDLARNGVIDAKTLSERVIEAMRSL